MGEPALVLSLLLELVEGCGEEGAVQGNVIQPLLHPLKALGHLGLQAVHPQYLVFGVLKP